MNNVKYMKFYRSAEPILHIELLSEHCCMFRTKKTHFAQAKAVHGERTYSLTKIHPFGVNSFIASTDKVKWPTCDYTIEIKKWMLLPSSCR